MANKTELETELLARLLADDDLLESLTSDGDDWSYEADGSCDDGAWADDSLWRRHGVDLYGQRVTLYAKPEHRGYEPGMPGIGEVYQVEVE